MVQTIRFLKLSNFKTQQFKKNVPLIQATIWINLKVIMLRESTQTQRVLLYDFIPMKFENQKMTLVIESQTVVAQWGTDWKQAEGKLKGGTLHLAWCVGYTDLSKLNKRYN